MPSIFKVDLRVDFFRAGRDVRPTKRYLKNKILEILLQISNRNITYHFRSELDICFKVSIVLFFKKKKLDKRKQKILEYKQDSIN